MVQKYNNQVFQLRQNLILKSTMNYVVFTSTCAFNIPVLVHSKYFANLMQLKHENLVPTNQMISMY